VLTWPDGVRARKIGGVMELPRYVSLEEARAACDDLGIRDWTQLREPTVELDEAERIQKEIGAEAAEVSTEDFRQGLEVELEHGRMFPDANVTNNHPVLTGLIVLAHLKEMLDYYDRLEIAEFEGDIVKALERGDAETVARLHAALISARARLASKELARTMPGARSA
jgi:hypothetical protein